MNILGERNQAGTLTGVGPPPGASDPEDLDDEEEGTAPKRPPRPLYRRLFNYVRQAWTGVKFALGIFLDYGIIPFVHYCNTQRTKKNCF